MGPCMGSLIMMGSFNKFNNNCKRDAILVCLVNCSTSFYGGLAIFAVLGFMAKSAGVTIDKVIMVVWRPCFMLLTGVRF